MKHLLFFRSTLWSVRGDTERPPMTVKFTIRLMVAVFPRALCHDVLYRMFPGSFLDLRDT